MNRTSQFLFCLPLIPVNVSFAQPQCECAGFWDAITPMAQPRDQICSAVVGGKIYVFGGHNHSVPGSAPNNRAESYDPATNTWMQLADMYTGRGMAACAAVNGIIYVIGGNDCFGNCWLETVEAYDPSTNDWSTKAPLPDIGCGTQGRGLHSAVAVGGKIYVMGGGNSYCSPDALNRVDVYDPGTNAWTQNVTTLPRRRAHHGAVEIGGKIYLVGGWSDVGGEHMVTEVDVYDVQGNAWSQVTSLPTGRAVLEVVAGCGRIYAIGGTPTPGSETGYLSVVEEYDTLADCWRRLTPLPSGQGWGAGAALDDGSIYVIGGNNAAGVQLDSCLRGDPRAILGDVNGDGVVDILDFLAVLFHWTSP